MEGKKSRKGKKIDNGIGNIQQETNVYTMTMMREDKQIKSIKDKSMQDRRKKNKQNLIMKIGLQAKINKETPGNKTNDREDVRTPISYLQTSTINLTINNCQKLPHQL